VWVPGLRTNLRHFLTGCRKRRLNQAPINFRSFIRLLMMDWSERRNINIAALVTIVIVRCNTLVARCSRQLIGPADLFFLSHGDPNTVISLEAVAYCSYCNTEGWFW